MDNKLKVLVIPTWYPNGKDKLMGQYHIDFAEALNKTGKMEADMLYVYRQLLSKPLDYVFSKKEDIRSEQSFTVYERKMLNLGPVSFALQMHNYCAALMKAYKSYEKAKGRPDVIHAHVSVPAGYAACKLGEKIGVPVMLTEHATYFERFFDGMESKYNKFALDNSKITCVGEYMVDIYKDKGYKSEVFPNIVDCSLFSAGTSVQKEEGLNLISVCAFRDVKRLGDVMAAVKKIRDENKNLKITYTMVGDGDYADNYRAEAVESGIDDIAVFTGRLPAEEIAKLLPGKSMLVIASEIETFGIPAVEALASGIPVVSTRCSGTEGIINDSCGAFCDVGDIQGMAEAIMKVYSSPEKYTAENCRKTALEYDSAHVAEKAYSMYKELIKK